MKNTVLILCSVFVVYNLISCVHVQQRSLSSANQCQNQDHQAVFNILQNDQQKIVIELNQFDQVLHQDPRDLNFQVNFKGSKEDKKNSEYLVKTGDINQLPYRLEIPVSKTGVYEVVIKNSNSKTIWKQKVFSIAASEHVLTEAEKKALAEQYAPVVSYHQDELYSPVSLEYLMNEVEIDPQLNNEKFRLTNKKIKSFSFFSGKPVLDIEFPFSEIRQILPFYGHSESVLKSALDKSSDSRMKLRYGKNHKTVYYSVFENKKWGEIYINYHFFYAYDPKNGTQDNDVLAAHIFDRESMTVVLRTATKKPLSVFYGAHLASQTMGQLNDQDEALQKWDSGRVFVNWPEVRKINSRPVPAIALGSHGVYPKKSTYAVFWNQVKLLKEEAGGTKFIYPAFDSSASSQIGASDVSSYQLKELKLDQVTSSCDNPQNILSFSGSTVDVLGPVNATFPPFTDREEDYMSYADPNAPLFDMTK